MQEIWKSLKGVVEYGDYYEVSNLGRVRSVDRKVNSRNGKRLVKGQILNQWIDKDGYCRVTLNLNQRKKHYGVHQLVALSFIQNSENKPQVNYKDGVKNNNHLDNLEWATNSENQQHAINIGLREGVKGENNSNSKLTDSKVIELFNKYKTNKYSMQQLSDEYGVSISVISNIVNGKTWKHLNLGSHKRDMSKVSIITDELINKVKELHSKGYSKRKIEREINVSRTTITKILDEY